MITLKTLPQATAQEVFDQVANHLLTQNEKSSVGDSCLYRTELENGVTLKCAAGCLIGDDEYNESLECNSWSILASDQKIPSTHHILISDLQSIHDHCTPKEWHKKLKFIAGEHDLEFNFPAPESTVVYES